MFQLVNLCVFFRNISIQVLCPFFFFFGLGCLFVCLYWVVWTVFIFRILTSLPVTSFANIFSHSISCFIILLIVSFAVKKPLSLIRSHLFIFAFISFAFGDWSEKILLWLTSKSVLPVFSSRVVWFQVLHYVFSPFWVYFCTCFEGVF